MKIGIFDSGYGGLTILREIRRTLPQYDYIYLGDNARAPYGTRSFDVIYRYTLEATQYLFRQGCEIVILACNTASAKALRTIQQRDLPQIWAMDGRNTRRVLGVIRPTVEAVCGAEDTRQHIGILGTQGTVDSLSYVTELHKLNPSLTVTQQACPMWVPLVENGEIDTPATDYFVHKYIHHLLAQDPAIDTILLACTHYPLLKEKIQHALTLDHNPATLICQGTLVAGSLADYLQRHPEIESSLSQGATCRYDTTESADKFSASASLFLDEPILANHIEQLTM